MTIQANIAEATEARAALVQHCLCLRVEIDEPGLLLVLLPEGEAVGGVRVRGMGRAEAYRIAAGKLEQIWKESML